MNFRDLLLDIYGGDFVFQIKLADGRMWRVRVSNSSATHKQIYEGLIWTFGRSYYREMLGQTVNHIQIRCDPQDVSKNRLYIDLANTKNTGTHTVNTFTGPNSGIYYSNNTNKRLTDDEVKALPDKSYVVSALFIFSDPQHNIKQDIRLYVSATGESPTYTNINALRCDLGLPDVFKNEKIDTSLSVPEYSSKYKVSFTTAERILDFAKIADPTLDDYASLVMKSSNDYWSHCNFEELKIKNKGEVIYQISRFVRNIEAIPDSLRWYMRGLPLEVVIRRSLAAEERSRLNYIRKQNGEFEI